MVKAFALLILTSSLALATGMSWVLSLGVVGLDSDLSQQVSVRSDSQRRGHIFVGGGLRGGK